MCNLGNIRYKEELIVDESPYILSEGFKKAVNSLPEHIDSQEDKMAYFKLIERWGTVSEHQLDFCHDYKMNTIKFLNLNHICSM